VAIIVDDRAMLLGRSRQGEDDDMALLWSGALSGLTERGVISTRVNWASRDALLG